MYYRDVTYVYRAIVAPTDANKCAMQQEVHLSLNFGRFWSGTKYRGNYVNAAKGPTINQLCAQCSEEILKKWPLYNAY
jgi:hypothetical protein